MKKKAILSMVGVAALMMLLALTQDDGSLQMLRQQLADLGLRVDRLEHAAGISNSGGGTDASAASSTAGAPAHSMMLVSVHIANVSPKNANEIAQLQQQCGALMNTVNASANAAAGAVGNAISNNDATYSRGGVSGWDNRGASGSERTAGGGFGFAQQAGDISTEDRYATLHAVKLQQLQALQQAANTPKQIILGHDANVIYTLNTKYDLTEARTTFRSALP